MLIYYLHYRGYVNSCTILWIIFIGPTVTFKSDTFSSWTFQQGGKAVFKLYIGARKDLFKIIDTILLEASISYNYVIPSKSNYNIMILHSVHSKGGLVCPEVGFVPNIIYIKLREWMSCTCGSYRPCEPLRYFRRFATIKLSFNKGCCHCHCQLW